MYCVFWNEIDEWSLISGERCTLFPTISLDLNIDITLCKDCHTGVHHGY